MAAVEVESYTGFQHWLVWSANDGTLLQTFSTAGSDFLLLSTSDEDEALLISGGTFTVPLECRDPVSGRLRWRREDIAFPAEGDLSLGSVDGKPAVRVTGRSRSRVCVRAATGLNVRSPSFVEAPEQPRLLRPEPPTAKLEVPPLHRIPCRLDPRPPPAKATIDWIPPAIAQQRALQGAILEWLGSAAPTPPATPVVARTLEPSQGIRLLLQALLNAGGGSDRSSVELSFAAATEVLHQLGPVPDDVLCLFALASEIRSTGWHLDPSQLARLRNDRAAQRFRRLRPFARCAGKGVVALHEHGGLPLVATLRDGVYMGPEPLIAWLSGALWQTLSRSNRPTLKTAATLPDVRFQVAGPERDAPV